MSVDRQTGGNGGHVEIGGDRYRTEAPSPLLVELDLAGRELLDAERRFVQAVREHDRAGFVRASAISRHKAAVIAVVDEAERKSRP